MSDKQTISIKELKRMIKYQEKVFCQERNKLLAMKMLLSSEVKPRQKKLPGN
jgi:hypothetical protein